MLIRFSVLLRNGIASKSSQLFILCALLCAFDAQAGTKEQARRLHDHLAGVPPSNPALITQMQSLIAANNAKAAARLVMDTDPFYNITLKNMFGSWSNTAGDPLVDLNDYSATAIGLVRDNDRFDKILYDDVIYVGNDSLVSTLNADNSVAVQRIIAPYQMNNNNHYTDLETRLINPNNPTDTVAANRTARISLRTYLVRKTQTAVTAIPEPAGIMTTRAGAAGYFSAGTNRRALRFTLKNFLCLDMDNLRDNSRPDFRVRRDVDRAPGGDSRTYKQTCVGCHAGMDALAGAFARYNFTDRLVYSTGVQGKLNQNGSLYPAGYVTNDDSWINLWIAGSNTFVGWKGLMSGNGARALGQMLTQTDAFPQCMARRVFKRVCLRDPKDVEAATIQTLATEFAANGNYNMRELFASVATLPQCLGE